MQEWQRIDDGTSIHKVGFRTIVSKQFRMNNGKIMQADINGTDGCAAAGVIALTSDNQVIIAKQFRCGPEKIMFEMPGGAVDPGESPEVAARRELLEETGYEAGTMEYLGTAYVNAWDNIIHHYYFARDCRLIGAHNPEEFEEIEVVTIPISEFIENALKANMTDAQGVLLAYDKLKSIEGGV